MLSCVGCPFSYVKNSASEGYLIRNDGWIYCTICYFLHLPTVIADVTVELLRVMIEEGVSTYAIIFALAISE